MNKQSIRKLFEVQGLRFSQQ